MTRVAFVGRAILLVGLVALGGHVLAQRATKSQASPPSSPLDRLSTVLDAFHVRDGRPAEQMEVIHRCGNVNPDLIQCALFDGRGAEAKLIGIEYVITAKGFDQLPAEERGLWHSHAYEVKSGQLFSPGVTASEQHALMKALVNTYGKTWHTWEMGQSLPTGRPELMMSFTRDGQARADLVDQRDRAFGISTAELRAGRADIEAPMLASGVDRGEGGRSCMAAMHPPVKGRRP